jgi:hypothetical protein
LYPYIFCCFFDRNINLFLLFLPFLMVEKWRSEPSLLMSRKNPLPLKQKSRDLTNPRLPLKRTHNQRLLNPGALLLLLLLRGTNVKGMKSKIPAAPNPVGHLPRKLLPRKRVASVL